MVNHKIVFFFIIVSSSSRTVKQDLRSNWPSSVPKNLVTKNISVIIRLTRISFIFVAGTCSPRLKREA